jgi:hypothetical protein
VLGLVIGGVLAATVAACGGDDQPVAPLAQISVDPDAAPAENGIDDNSPPEALAESIATMEATGSYRVSGTTLAGSTIDISFEVGVGSVGSVTTGAELNLISIDDAMYVTGDPAALGEQVGADVGSTIAGKWLLMSPEAATSMSIFADAGTFATSVLGSEDPNGITSVREVDGVPAVGLLFPETGGTLWVAATGDPLPLRFEEKGATASSGVLTFGDFGAEVAIAAPDADSVVDMTAG